MQYVYWVLLAAVSGFVLGAVGGVGTYLFVRRELACLRDEKATDRRTIADLLDRLSCRTPVEYSSLKAAQARTEQLGSAPRLVVAKPLQPPWVTDPPAGFAGWDVAGPDADGLVWFSNDAGQCASFPASLWPGAGRAS